MEYTYKEVLEAYIKLKTYIYYDSTNLYMRRQLAVFETNLTDDDEFLNRFSEYSHLAKKYNVDLESESLNIYEQKLKVFTEALNTFHEKPEYFQRFLQRIEAKFLPKKIKDKDENSKIISNKRTYDQYTIERSSVFFDAPIEIHLISILWILKKGIYLDKDLFEGCLGNRLILNKEKNNVVQGSALFKPYPKQYQKWRDESVEVAREQLQKGNNVLLLNLDIKDFFYSVRIPREQIEESLHNNRKVFQALNNLYKIFADIHEIFTRKIALNYKIPYDFTSEVCDEKGNITHYILPIGLLSSFVLANHHLIEFDNRILKKSRAIHYSRYVDDILMVIVNPAMPDNDKDDFLEELNFDFSQYQNWLKKSESHDDQEFLSQKNYYKLSDLEQYVLKNFNPIITLIDTPDFLASKDNFHNNNKHIFKLNGYSRLYCQSSKTSLYYFDKNESSLVIDKLKRDLDEKSSEFRNYTDAEGEDEFEESAYHLLYDGTEGKIRTLKDYKEDKFGLSVYLSKRIFNALRRADKISEKEAGKIVTFFKGSNTLNLYTLWERIFVFFLVNNKPEAYVQFYLNCCEAIMRIDISPGSASIESDDYQDHVLGYLECANEMALSLHPKFLSEVKKVKRTYLFSFNAMKNNLRLYSMRYTPIDETSFYIRRFRQSNLVRHHYAAQPLLTYTKSDKRDYKNFTELKFTL